MVADDNYNLDVITSEGGDIIENFQRVAIGAESVEKHLLRKKVPDLGFFRMKI